MPTALTALLFGLWVAALVFLRRYRIWLLYYGLGAVGAAYWLSLVAHATPLELGLAQSVAWVVNQITNRVGIPTRIFRNAPDVLLVLVITQDIGWTMLRIGVESSGLLEMSVLFSLLAFYPSRSWRQKAGLIAVGLLLTWLANILRVLVIVVMLHQLGKSALFLAHTLIGRTLFFFLTVAIYWLLLTRPAMHTITRRFRASPPA